MADPTGTRNILDEPAAMARADTEDMLGFIDGFPEQAAEGWRVATELELPWATPRSVAIVGVGDSASGGDLARGIWADRISVPIAVLRGYELPAWVGPETLVIASSRSGDTEETLSQLEAALARRCPVVVVTSGGAMKRVAEAAGLPLAALPDPGVPRSSVGATVAAIGGILSVAGVLELAASEVEAGVAAARDAIRRCGPDVPTADNPAKRLAWSLVDRFVLVTGSDFLVPVARRWKAQLNENGKTLAIDEELPEATHNTVVGFEQPESLRDHLALVSLRSSLEHPRNALRNELLGDVLDTGQIWHTAVQAEGEGRLAQALDTVVTGDLVSVYLAFMYAIDPAPVDVVTHIKEQLALADQAGTE